MMDSRDRNVVYMDFSKAFDKVPVEVQMAKYEALEINRNLPLW